MLDLFKCFGLKAEEPNFLDFTGVTDLRVKRGIDIMGKFPLGPITPHLKSSHGGESHTMKFYATTNETTYGAHWSNFEPQRGKHTGTGYLANFRPGVYYSANLDIIDNPMLGRLVAQNYKSQTHKDMTPYTRPFGTEVLPRSTHQVPSGFVNEKAVTVPNFLDVKRQFINGRLETAPADLQVKHKPLLHTLRKKDPTELENCGYGPASMSTEYVSKFKGMPTECVNTNRKSLGPKEETGFTENRKTIEPITFVPDSPHRGNHPGWMTMRPTGISVQNTSYRPLEYLHGNETLPAITGRSTRDTGFVKGHKNIPDYVQINPDKVYDKASDIPEPRLAHLKKNDPSEYLNAVHPDKNSTITMGTFLGKQRPDMTMASRLHRSDVGPKEGTGNTANNDRWIQQSDDVRRFFTHHMSKFYDTTPQGDDRHGHLTWGLQPLPLDGYTKSTKTHSMAEVPEAMHRLMELDPYHARSTLARETMPTDTTKMVSCN